MANKIQKQNLTNRGRGRPKGSENKLAKEAKDVIAAAASELGGEKRLIEWVNKDLKHESIFWSQIYTKLIPVQVTGKDGDAIKMDHTISPAEKLKTMVSQIEKRSREAGGSA